MANVVDKEYINKLRIIYQDIPKELESDKNNSILRNLRIARDLPVELLKNLVDISGELEEINDKLVSLVDEDERLAGLINENSLDIEFLKQALRQHRDLITTLQTRAENIEIAAQNINLGLVANVSILCLEFSTVQVDSQTYVNLISINGNNGNIDYSCPIINGTLFETDKTITNAGILKLANVSNRKIELEINLEISKSHGGTTQYFTGLKILNAYSGNLGDMPDSFDICILETGDVIKNTSYIKARVV